MRSLGSVFLVAVAVVAVTALSATPLEARSVGQAIDDTAITAQVKAKLAADKLSNLTKIEVRTDQGIVTLNGTVESVDRVIRAEQAATSVNGVRGIVNNLHVAGSTVPSSTASSHGPGALGLVDATGVVAHFDPSSSTITLQDGRVLRATGETAIWQPGTLQTLRPGSTVLVRGAALLAVPPTASTGPPDWRMGTVRMIDPASTQIVLTDGTVVRVAPTAHLHRGRDRIAFEQIVPGSEVVIRTMPSAWGGAAEGSALPGRVAAGPTIDASDVNVVWTPSGMR